MAYAVLAPKNDNKHWKLHKKKAPNWKEVYKEQCRQRMKENRDAILEKRRSGEYNDSRVLGSCDKISSHRNHCVQSVSELMRNEWGLLQSEHTELQLPNIPEIIESQSSQESNSQTQQIYCGYTVDELISIWDEIGSELAQEEDSIWREFEAAEHFEEAAVCDAIDRLCVNEEDVLCPLCRRCNLTTDNITLSCSCGLNMVFDKPREKLLSEVSMGVCEGLSLHQASSCPVTPECACVVTNTPSQHTTSAANAGADKTLLLCCKVCDFLYVIL